MVSLVFPEGDLLSNVVYLQQIVPPLRINEQGSEISTGNGQQLGSATAYLSFTFKDSLLH